ncbi:hypothetical protein G6F62_013520 [Rhizopus arrhizus]|nr:hypothetical protein G6F62_013520 [Rhizopus arrhizus]
MTAASTIGTAPRSRARLVLAGLSACGLAALAWASFVHPLPRLIYNPSDSVPMGWYRHRLGLAAARCRSAGRATPLPAGGRAAAQARGRDRAAGGVHRWRHRPHRRRAFGRRAARRPLGPAAAILAAVPPPRTGRVAPVERDQSGIVRWPVFRAGAHVRRDQIG